MAPDGPWPSYHLPLGLKAMAIPLRREGNERRAHEDQNRPRQPPPRPVGLGLPGGEGSSSPGCPVTFQGHLLSTLQCHEPVVRFRGSWRRRDRATLRRVPGEDLGHLVHLLADGPPLAVEAVDGLGIDIFPLLHCEPCSSFTSFPENMVR